MAQATRCPHCQTAFKVVRDQLLLREGWVRCGHCGEPFNALDHLITPSSTAPAPEPAESATVAPEPTHTDVPAQSPTAPVVAGLRWEHIPADQPAYQGFLPLTAQAYDMKSAPQPEPAATPEAPGEQDKASPDAPAFEPAQDTRPVDQEPHPGIASEFPAEDNEPVEPDLDPAASRLTFDRTAGGEDAAPLSEFNLNDALNYHFGTDDTPAAATSPALAHAAAQEPEFVRQAHRQARWNSIPVRVALGALSLLLLLLLAAQATLFWRDNLAQQWPTSRPWLQQLCHATTGCELGAPRDLDALVIDSSALSPAETGLQLTVLLRNRQDRAVAWPALELTLTDAQGRIEQRKVMEPAHYLPATQATASALRAGIAPGQQMQLQLHLALSGAAPAGYKLVLFYP
ncbi:MAG: hypothetical protein B7Z83_02650 [Thiomonas sp. 20-64-5]|nr:MAG: hypothetical protein B7Z83_02650 [Thiomonas sp. 20-64-5]